MEELNKLQNEINRTKAELTILYEISNAMRTTLRLEEILYIILTGVTAHVGLGFNRAMLFLVNEKEGVIEGKLGIGPHTGEEANKIWSQIERDKMDLDDLISDETKNLSLDSTFNQQVQEINIPLKQKNGSLLNMCALDGMPLHLRKTTISNYLNDPLVKLFKLEEIVIVPLKAKDKVNGMIVADNLFTKKPITKDDMRMLMMLCNQAGLAIENSHLYEQTVVQSHRDSLTGLWNHGYFQQILRTELEKAKATDTPLSLLMIDLDNFKDYNDRFGHQLGDQILKELASLLNNYSRNMDYVCRYGGEEFSIILPQTNKKEASLIANRLKQAIEKYPFYHKGTHPEKSITASIGISTFPKDGSSASSLISHSDKALYEAKKKGGNQICG